MGGVRPAAAAGFGRFGTGPLFDPSSLGTGLIRGVSLSRPDRVRWREMVAVYGNHRV